jgi:hypothetical protein
MFVLLLLSADDSMIRHKRMTSLSPLALTLAPIPLLTPVICDEGDPYRCPHMNLFVSDPSTVRCSFHSTPTPRGSTAEPVVGGAIVMRRDDMFIIADSS